MRAGAGIGWWQGAFGMRPKWECGRQPAFTGFTAGFVAIAILGASGLLPRVPRESELLERALQSSPRPPDLPV